MVVNLDLCAGRNNSRNLLGRSYQLCFATNRVAGVRLLEEMPSLSSTTLVVGFHEWIWFVIEN